MSGFKFGARSLRNMEGIHPDLRKVLVLALHKTPIDFVVIEGVRPLSRQRELVKSGASTTMNSRHLTGHAVDVAPVVNREVRFDWPLYHKLAPAFKEAAKELNIPIVWGGDWKTFKDGPHFELDRKFYKA
jgi:peptidoglycan L-alanyl-D-glutamate endopeptidase CwlK